METTLKIFAHGREHDIQVKVAPMEGHPGVWRAEIVELDYFAQGRSESEAIEAAREVATILLLEHTDA